MHFPLLAFMYVGTPARFETRQPQAEVMRRLRLLTACEASEMLRECVSGTVDEDGQVCLWHEIYQWRNSFAPRFYGQFEQHADGTCLRGAFKPPLFTRILFGYAVLFMVAMFGILAVHMLNEQAWLFLAGLIVVAVFMVVLASTRRTASTSDQDAIAATIRQALAEPSHR